MLNKRSYNGGKNSVVNRIKNKDMTSKTTNFKSGKTSYPQEFFDTEPKSPSFPHIKPSENTDILPCYASVLSKPSEEGITMKDLDQLQLELEKLLSVCAVRNRSLCSEYESIEDRKGKSFERPSSPKIRKIEEKNKLKVETKPFKIVKNVHDELPKLEVPKPTIPRNDTKSKFWLSVDPFCTPVTRDDLAYLKDLTAEINTDVALKIPPLGPHYSVNWNGDSVTSHFQGGVENLKHSKNKLMTMLTDDSYFKNQKNFCNGESYPLLLPLASALLEEKVVNNFNPDKEKFKDIGIRSVNNSVCLDKRMRKELVDLGILNAVEDDIKPVFNEDDQILEEIKKCHKELVTVNAHNKRELNNLRYLIDKDMIRQELNEKLDKVDGQIMEVYNQLMSANSKEKTDLEWEAVKIIQLQRKLHKEAIEMTDVRL